MKRAKITLVIVAALAIVSGAFAVKASRFTGIQYYTTNVSCAVPPFNNTFVGKTVPGTNKVYYTNIVGHPACNYGAVSADIL